MRICLIAENINPHSGLGRMAVSIADGLTERGHKISFVSENYTSKYQTLVVPFRQYFRRPFRSIFQLLKLRFFLKRHDVIVCFDTRPAGIIAYLAMLGRIKNVAIHSLGTYSLFTENGQIKNWLMKQVYNKVGRVWPINDFVKKQIEASNSSFLFKDNIRYIPVGVDTKLFIGQTKRINKYPDSYILSVGALKPRKGQLKSLKAFENISKKYPELHYIFVGSTTDSPEYYIKIKKFIKDNGLQNKVVFIENASDKELIDLYNNAIFFILTPVSSPNSIEGFGMVYIEAALCGKTSLGTYGSGAEVAIENNQTGLLVQPNYKSIMTGMNLLLTNEKKRKQFEKRAYQRALTFDWFNVVDLYEEELQILKK
ncbi:MAG: glycosyltransferase family 4 protein [Patescibacteria group bacterium UBA2163]